MAVSNMAVLAVVAVLADSAMSWTSVSVEDYGAVGDNQTDNTKAFREALLAVKDGGGEVVVPQGKTCVSSSFASEHVQAREHQVPIFRDVCVRRVAPCDPTSATI